MGKVYTNIRYGIFVTIARENYVNTMEMCIFSNVSLMGKSDALFISLIIVHFSFKLYSNYVKYQMMKKNTDNTKSLRASPI